MSRYISIFKLSFEGIFFSVLIFLYPCRGRLQLLISGSPGRVYPLKILDGFFLFVWCVFYVRHLCQDGETHSTRLVWAHGKRLLPPSVSPAHTVSSRVLCDVDVHNPRSLYSSEVTACREGNNLGVFRLRVLFLLGDFKVPDSSTQQWGHQYPDLLFEN